MDIGTAGDWTQVIWGACVLLFSIISIAVFLVRRDLKMSSKLDSIAAQQVPNGGSSMRDAINRIESHIVRIEEKIDGHVTWHLGEKDE